VVEIIPLWLVNVLSFITVFSVMAAIGTTITPSVSIRHLRSPSLLVRGLVSVLVIVPGDRLFHDYRVWPRLARTGRCGLDGDCPWCAASLAPGIGVGC